MKTYKIKIQTSATKIESIEVKANNEKEAWGIAGKSGIVIGISII